MKIPIKLWVLAGVAAVFFLVTIYAFTNRPKSNPVDLPDIAEMLPKALPGWEVTDLPVGQTEEVMRRMGEILNYDTAFLREYKKGITKVEVYISYWTPGKAHYRLVYGHTPDVCWVKAGWKSVMQNSSYIIQLDGTESVELKPAQYREFMINSEHLRVVFWQLLDGKPFTYGNFGPPPRTAIFTDILERGFNQKPEQWFIRISANVDFDQLFFDPGFQELMRSMAGFGLVKE